MASTPNPMNRTLDFLGQRWVPQILWELYRREELGAAALRDRCGGISSSVLHTRLAGLIALGLVEQPTPRGAYRLTRSGEDLGATLDDVERWAMRWLSPSGHS